MRDAMNEWLISQDQLERDERTEMRRGTAVEEIMGVRSVIPNIYASCSLSHPGAKQRKGRAARDTEVYQP
jgi:hypothetical protein